MGIDKAQIRLDPIGPTMLDRAVSVAFALSSDVLVIGREAIDHADGRARFVPDRQPGQGPLAGIATALEVSAFERCLVIPCDAPFLSLPVLRWMATIEMSGDAVIPVTIDASRQQGQLTYQTLHAIYRKSSLRFICEALDSGSRRTTDWFDAAHIQVIPEDGIRQLDPDLLTFFTMNTPADLERAQTIYHALNRASGTGTTKEQPL